MINEAVKPIHVISLGAGVQSSTMALMAAHGEIEPMPAAAFFADTQAEPANVYRWLDWLEAQLPFPVVRVSKGNLGDAACNVRTSVKGRKYTKHAIPAFIKDPEGRVGLMMRQCTQDFKIEELYRGYRAFANVPRACKEVRLVQWIGISLDEFLRGKPSRRPWVESRHPLIEQRITRNDCLNWMQAKGYPTPPRSACKFCPYHNDAEWLRMKTEEPDEFAQAVAWERRYQEAGRSVLRGVPYLHRSCQPLDTVDFNVKSPQLNLFNNECEGMCGV